MSRREITDSDTTRCSCPMYLNSNVRSVRRFPKRRTRFPTAATPFVNFARNCPKTLRKSDILARLFGCRDVAQPGSAPALGAGCRRFESCRPDQSRVWFNGRTEAFQASNAGSIPVTRSIKTPGQSLIDSDLFVCVPKCAPSCGPNAGQIGKKLQTLLFRELHTGSCLLGRATAFKCVSDPPKAITGRSAILMCARDCSFSSMMLSRE